MSTNRSLTAVPGVLAGHWTADSGTTGCTAILFPDGAVGSVVVPGSASGTRELQVLEARHVAARFHGISLSGGSAFGLSTADGVMSVLRDRGIGHPTPGGVVPIVPAAILFDLDRGETRPDAASGRAAALAATGESLGEGKVGAGAGATVAKLSGGRSPGGFGSWATRFGGYTIAAGVAVNALGSIRDPATGEWVTEPPPTTVSGHEGTNTTIGVIATDAPLVKGQVDVFARMASAGMARAVWPAYSPFDGDTVFGASTGDGSGVDTPLLAGLGHAAAEALAIAIVRAVRAGAAG